MITLPRRTGFVATVVESAVQTVWRLAHLRLWWLAGLATAVLCGLGFVLGARADDRFDGRTLFCMLGWWVHLTVLLPWVTMFLAVQVVHGAIEDRTVQYLFLRPVSRMALLLGNLFAVAVVGAGFGGLAMAALFGVFAGRASLWPDGVDGRLLWVYLEGCVWSALAYAAVGTLFSVFFRRPLVAASFFVVGLQMLTANLPVSAGLRQLTITDPVRRLVLDGIEPDSVLAARLWPAERSFRMDELGQPRLDLAWFVGVMAVLALLYYRRTEYDARHRE